MTPNGRERNARANKHTSRPEPAGRPAGRPDGIGRNPRADASFIKNPSQIVVKPLPEGMLLDLLEQEPQGLYLILDCIQDPHNLGAILRSADGAGVTAVIAPKDKSVGITETVLRISVGAAEKVPFIQVTNLARAMKQIKDAGVWISGTSDKADRSLYDIDLKGGVAIVMGAEGDGLRRLTEENCDFLISLPMHGSVPCLNVSVATGICLYEAVRQRNL